MNPLRRRNDLTAGATFAIAIYLVALLATVAVLAARQAHWWQYGVLVLIWLVRVTSRWEFL